MTDPTAPLDRLSPMLSPLARGLFAAILLPYFWASAVTKLGEGTLGFLHPSTGAYAQIFPRVFEAAGYDEAQLGMFHWAITVAGTWAEFLLPVLVVLGVATRLSALGMICFIVVQSLTDLVGHGGLDQLETRGAWFDRWPDGVILDQRALWVFLLAVLVIKGGGPLALDRVIFRSADVPRPGDQRPAPAGPRPR
ncbi:DoxX family membrane protein [Pseudooceanicola sediminis]|uniref:DoxX family membrane protein n=1 Tax=Pseudooceanicola sediminis TaxID=2211117 RepID=A0A399J3R1_9RHOB|nr:DoxX family membrane protein [Pseudooceanicola sediminis]KAA2314146.1 DoxX family membrane protein [Puniceibacterium sp. HSS470]RII39994.1 DoxX family membrane protein [Pseudooceanicola sediminis]|tara:strand:- start:53932 stop:54513 length:582 start_codon:yes stop_codon:yes gene_type:complete